MAISVVSASSLENAHVAGTQGLAGIVPNLAVSQTATYAEIYIRGIGSSNLFNGSESSIAVNLDGIYLARPFAQFMNFLDVDRVEVLRGPQGTLYGRNATGGAINIVSKTPGDELQAEALLAYGDYNSVDLASYVSGPLAKDISGSFAFSYDRHDPYRTNVVASGNDVDNDNTGATRGQLRAQLAPNLVATTRADYARSTPNTANGVIDLTRPPDPVTASVFGNYGKVALDQPQTSDTQLIGVSEDIGWDLGPLLHVRSLTGYRNDKSIFTIDGDATAIPAQIIHFFELSQEITQEIDLSGHFRQLDYVGGVYYFHSKERSQNFIDIEPADLLLSQRPISYTDAEAVFAQATYHVLSTVSFVAGGRYSVERKAYDQFTSAQTLPITNPGQIVAYDTDRYYHAFTPKVGINWTPLSTLLVYGSITRGFKSGGFNVTSTDPNQGFNPEYVTSYEAGVKSQLLDRRVNLNLTGFHYDYTNLQEQIFLGPGDNAIVNAASAKIDGVEVESVARPVSGLDLTANVAYLNARYINYPNAPLFGGTTINASGNRLNNSPAFNGNLAAQYTYSLARGGDVYGRGEYSYRSRVYFDPSNIPILGQGGYGLVNASLGYETPGHKWRAEMYGRNLTDKDYVINTFTTSTVPGGTPGAPRTFGFQVTWKY